ncbi:hypothetical protein BJ508DRAFT_302561 [Ascobolus immersus RN42]|uniref:C2H2-type domain-containing protein n=1 Tax=Ascobolus immersus RN42 TaxID=1160509 RepID=A0A3N4IJC1_ASCIM|nr:hypothetical protein BJ508DRAFT_302561 [Ascobolus immersus RN42]
MSEAIASVPLRDDFSQPRTTTTTTLVDRAPVPGINDLERLAIQFKQQDPSLSDEMAKNQALQQMLRDAAMASKGTASVTEHANARRPQESTFRRSIHPQSGQQPAMPIRTNANQNSAGLRTSHAPSPSKPINPSRSVGYSPYPTVIHRPQGPKPTATAWNNPQYPPNMTFSPHFSNFGPTTQRHAYPPHMSQKPVSMLSSGSTFPTSNTRSFAMGTATQPPKPNDLSMRQPPNHSQETHRHINAAISETKSETIENWINTKVPNELGKTQYPPSPPPSTTERSVVDLTVSGNDTALSSPQNLTSLNSPSQAAPTQSTEPQESAPKPKRRRQRPREPVKCEVPDCGRSFSSPHELRRHHRREHDNEKWVIVDITPDKRLKGCKRCDNGHIYGAKYNATAHLKRKHVNLRKRKEGQKELDCPHPDNQPKEFTQYANQFVQPKKTDLGSESDEEASDCVIEAFGDRSMQSHRNNSVVSRPDEYFDYPAADQYFQSATTPHFTAQQATFIGPDHYQQFFKKQSRGELYEQFSSGSGSFAVSPNMDLFSAFGAANDQALNQAMMMPNAMPDFNNGMNMAPNYGTGIDENNFDFGRELIDTYSTTGMLADVDLASMVEGSEFLDNMLAF